MPLWSQGAPFRRPQAALLCSALERGGGAGSPGVDGLCCWKKVCFEGGGPCRWWPLSQLAGGVQAGRKPSVLGRRGDISGVLFSGGRGASGESRLLSLFLPECLMWGLAWAWNGGGWTHSCGVQWGRGAHHSFVCPQPREKGRMRFHKLQNVQIALDYLKHRQVSLGRAGGGWGGGRWWWARPPDSSAECDVHR